MSRTFLFILICVIFIAANKKNKNTCKYSPYQVLMFELKANEGFRSNWYKDGIVNGNQAYSIGYGWSDWGGKRRKYISNYLADGKIDNKEATLLIVSEIKNMGILNKDPYKNVAMQLYSYNRGLIRSSKKLGRCCGARYGCGSPNFNVRQSHNRRRKFELALFKHDFDTIEKMMDGNIQVLKNRGGI